jgi:hypothetical protein
MSSDLRNRLFVAVSDISHCCQQRGSCEDYSLAKCEAVHLERYLPAFPEGRTISIFSVAVLKKQIVCSSDSLVTNYQVTRRHIPFTTVKNSSLL